MSTNRRFWEIMAGLLLLVLGLGAVAGGPDQVLAALLLIGGFYLLAKQFDKTRRAFDGELTSRPADLPDTRSAHGRLDADQVYAHAVDAVRHAGLDPSQTQVLPVDLGVAVYHGGEPVAIHRTQPVPDDADYVQPFVRLRLPTRATGRIRFEIVDGDGQTLFIHEDFHQLERGLNLVTPPARLALHTAQARHDSWQLRISADGTLLAAHRFDWAESAETYIRRQMSADGEITPELGEVLSDHGLDSISLDELLADQQEAERRARR